MKFFIFTCLLAVALAKHKYKQANDAFFQTAQVSASSSSSEESAEEINDKIVQTEEQKVNLNEQKKIKQFSQDLSCSQFCTPVPQQQINLNQWAQGKAIRNIPDQESITIAVQIKNNQFHQFTIPQFPQAVHQQQVPVTYWNRPYTYPYAPYVIVSLGMKQSLDKLQYRK
ncbi:alpha-S2-casein-like A [Alexandromys fortis]|uniref:alpha-S2-casein-like A n=1 Tax=Alexandromys fortis TaxID=100897 RepID=UPI002152A9E4|nr:alpha-S2-casein-like A [Microtus fortis]